jgi:SAM-dependent methyltransferase
MMTKEDDILDLLTPSTTYTALSHFGEWANLGTYATLDEAQDAAQCDNWEPYGIKAAGDGHPSYWRAPDRIILREPPSPSLGLLALRYEFIYSILSKTYVRRIPEYHDISRLRSSRLRTQYPDFRSALDIGCGTGQAMRALDEQDFVVFGAEVSSEMARSALREDRCAVINNSFLNIVHGPFHLLFDSATFHLYPSVHESLIFQRFRSLLYPLGALTISTTVSAYPSENWEIKSDYPLGLRRYRRHFTLRSLLETFIKHGFAPEDVLNGETSGKKWIAVTGRKALA